MNSSKLTLACVAVLAAAALLWFLPSSAARADGGTLDQSVSAAAESVAAVPAAGPTAGPAVEALPAVAAEPDDRVESPVPVNDSPAWATRVPEDDGVTGWNLAPLFVQVIDSLSGERVPFQRFTVRDDRRETLVGCTDAMGRFRSADLLSVGQLHVEVPNGRDETTQPKQPHTGDADEPSVWRLHTRRSVPLAVDVPEALADRIELWLLSAAEDGQQQRTPLRVERLKNVSVDQLAGATHVFELHASPFTEARAGTTTSFYLQPQLDDWTQRNAGQRIQTRKICAVVVDGGEVLASSTLVPDLPLLGEPPIQLRLALSSASSLPTPLLQAWYASEVAEQVKEQGQLEALAERETFALQGVVTSNSGEFRDTVFVRASPVDDEPGAMERRKQWITVNWSQGSDGTWTAPFHLDELDAGPYRILALTSDAMEVSGSPHRADVSDGQGPPLTFTVLD